MSYRSDREAFVYRLAALGWPLADIRAVLRDAGIVRREHESGSRVTDRLIQAAERAERIASRNNCLSETRRLGLALLPTKPRSFDWIEVPASGLRAAQLERLAGGR